MSLMQVMMTGKRRWLMLAAGVVFLLLQTINLQHNHDGDLNLQSDCQICLKLGSTGTGLPASTTLPAFETGFVSFQQILPEPRVFMTRTADSRAPPPLVV